MSHDDERDYAVEAANRSHMMWEQITEGLAEYVAGYLGVSTDQIAIAGNINYYEITVNPAPQWDETTGSYYIPEAPSYNGRHRK